MSQPFTEMKPVPKRFFQVVVTDASRSQIWQCSVCEMWISEEEHCGVCGREICCDCSVASYTSPDLNEFQSLCAECARLPRDVQDAAYVLRKALNA